MEFGNGIRYYGNPVLRFLAAGALGGSHVIASVSPHWE
jgi:hypothetical protein